MSCGCHKGCGRPCNCHRRTHRPFCSCPEEEERCVRVETVMSEDLRRRKRRCRRVRSEAEIPIGTISIDCGPVHFESAREVETIAACCVNGFRQPGVMVPFDPTPFITPVPSKFGPEIVFSTRSEQISTTI